MNRTLDHIAIVVRDTEEALRFWRDVLGLQPSGQEIVSDQGVRVTFLPIGTTTIELVEPLTADNGVARYLDKMGTAAALHHLCFGVPDLEEILQTTAASGLPMIDKEPRRGAHDRSIAFLHPRAAGGVLVELVQQNRHDPPSTQPAEDSITL